MKRYTTSNTKGFVTVLPRSAREAKWVCQEFTDAVSGRRIDEQGGIALTGLEEGQASNLVDPPRRSLLRIGIENPDTMTCFGHCRPKQNGECCLAATAFAVTERDGHAVPTNRPPSKMEEESTIVAK